MVTDESLLAKLCLLTYVNSDVYQEGALPLIHDAVKNMDGIIGDFTTVTGFEAFAKGVGFATGKWAANSAGVISAPWTDIGETVMGDPLNDENLFKMLSMYAYVKTRNDVNEFARGMEKGITKYEMLATYCNNLNIAITIQKITCDYMIELFDIKENRFQNFIVGLKHFTDGLCSAVGFDFDEVETIFDTSIDLNGTDTLEALHSEFATFFELLPYSGLQNTVIGGLDNFIGNVSDWSKFLQWMKAYNAASKDQVAYDRYDFASNVLMDYETIEELGILKPAPAKDKLTVYMNGPTVKLVINNLDDSIKPEYAYDNKVISVDSKTREIKAKKIGATELIIIRKVGKEYKSIGKVIVTIKEPYVKITDSTMNLSIGNNYKFS